MTIEERRLGDIVVLSVAGDITMRGSAVPRLADKVRSLVQDGHLYLVLDLGRVRYVDSAGLGDLVQASAAVRSRGGEMKLLNVGRRLTDLLVVTRLLTVFDCYEQEGAALASFDQHHATYH